MKVGVLALQGDVSEHMSAVRSAMAELGLQGDVIQVRRPAELAQVSALLMPGGESTTIAKQLRRFGLWEPILEFGMSGKPIMGTCAGCILLSSEIVDQVGPKEVDPLCLIDISVRRNAFGRQAESFEHPLTVEGLDNPYPGIFIRAPGIVGAGEDVEVLASLDGEPVLVRQKNIMALTFHPELAGDDRIHRMFLGMLRP